MEELNIKMWGDNILVKPSEVQNESTGGIMITQEARSQSQDGTVVAVGLVAKNQWVVAVGDRVVFARYAGAGIVIDGEKYVVLKASEIYMTIDSDVDLRTPFGTSGG